MVSVQMILNFGEHTEPLATTTQKEERLPYTEEAESLEVSVKSTPVHAPACNPSPCFAQSRRKLLFAHPSCTQASCSREVSTPLPVLVSA